MQTVTLDIQDNFMKEFLTIIEQYKDKIQLKKDTQLEYDPYFYERQHQLHKIREEIKSGQVEMVSHELVWGNIKKHLTS